MKRLTTDMPENNTETALNLFYVKDKWAWVTGGGPKYEDISLCDYIRMIVKEHKLDIKLGFDDYELTDAIAERLFDGTDTIEGIAATLYTTGWAFAEIRERLKMYEDILFAEDGTERISLEQLRAMTTPQPNPPLTLEELREMDGKPVWIVGVSAINNFKGHWDICDWRTERSVLFPYCMESPGLDLYGLIWLAYRRKPEEADNHG